MELLLSPKFKDFFKHKAQAEFLEGQTFAGKTTVGVPKAVLRAIAMPKKYHGISGLDLGTVEKNIINAEAGLLQVFGANAEYNPNGKGKINLPHVEIKTSKGSKIFYVFGYNDEARWKKALGGQLGVLIIDEINIANNEYVQEAFMRADYVLCTLNPDDPNLKVYKDYINRSRPLKKYEKDYPEELLSQIYSEPEQLGWTHWYFTMDDNASATEEKKAQIRASVPIGTKRYKNKILGLRGRSEGLVFDKFERKDKVVALQDFKFLPNESVFRIFCGLDSGINADATSLVTALITTAGRKIIIPSFYYKPKEGTNASSQQALLIQRWLDHWLNYFGCFVPQLTLIIGDSAALTQALMLEINLSTHYNSIPVGKKDIATDITRAIGTMEREDLIIINAGDIDPTTMQKRGEMDMLVIEVENKVWDRKKGNVPEDGNDHCIDAFKYLTWYLYYGGVI